MKIIDGGITLEPKGPIYDRLLNAFLNQTTVHVTHGDVSGTARVTGMETVYESDRPIAKFTLESLKEARMTSYAVVPAGFSVVEETEHFVAVRIPTEPMPTYINPRPFLERCEELMRAELDPIASVPGHPMVICRKRVPFAVLG